MNSNIDHPFDNDIYNRIIIQLNRVCTYNFHKQINGDSPIPTSMNPKTIMRLLICSLFISSISVFIIYLMQDDFLIWLGIWLYIVISSNIIGILNFPGLKNRFKIKTRIFFVIISIILSIELFPPVRIPVKSHSESGACRTVGERKHWSWIL